MGKIFGLSLFVSFFLAGIALGRRRAPPAPRDVLSVLVFFVLFYIGMGVILTIDTEFLRPE